MRHVLMCWYARIFATFSILLLSFLGTPVGAISQDDITGVIQPKGSISLPGSPEGSDGITGVLMLIQNILITVVLPLVVIGSAFYIALLLFTAQGDETQMKQAWKAIAYTASALIAIALAYAGVALVAQLNFG